MGKMMRALREKKAKGKQQGERGQQRRRV